MSQHVLEVNESGFEELILHRPTRPLQSPNLQPSSQGDGRPSRTLRAAVRWPAAILDRRPPPCMGQGRSGRRDGSLIRSNIGMNTALVVSGQPSLHSLRF